MCVLPGSWLLVGRGSWGCSWSCTVLTGQTLEHHKCQREGPIESQRLNEDRGTVRVMSLRRQEEVTLGMVLKYRVEAYSPHLLLSTREEGPQSQWDRPREPCTWGQDIQGLPLHHFTLNGWWEARHFAQRLGERHKCLWLRH